MARHQRNNTASISKLDRFVSSKQCVFRSNDWRGAAAARHRITGCGQTGPCDRQQICHSRLPVREYRLGHLLRPIGQRDDGKRHGRQRRGLVIGTDRRRIAGPRTVEGQAAPPVIHPPATVQGHCLAHTAYDACGIAGGDSPMNLPPIPGGCGRPSKTLPNPSVSDSTPSLGPRNGIGRSKQVNFHWTFNPIGDILLISNKASCCWFC
jgi:hypothetical protein